MKNHEFLKCLGTGKLIKDDGKILAHPECGKPAFLRAEYLNKQFRVREEMPGLYKFSMWMPIFRTLEGSAAPVTYKSEGLAKKLGLKNLYITFNGYWPEKGAYMLTGTFKECEAFSVCARIPENCEKTLVVASAGNTARAFTRVCSENKIPLAVVVPEANLNAMWFEKPIDPCVKLIAAGKGCDYTDAINLSQIICQHGRYMAEGGAANVARRDGMATTVLSAVTTIGEIPDYYFQAVGSGTGAIAAWEANLRFIESGEYRAKKMRLMVSQNAPFLVIYDSWKAGTRELVVPDEETAKQQLEMINAKVLSNRKPPYGIIGGLFDALTDTGGDVLSANNDEASAAKRLFEETEGNDPSPAAAVAIATLIKAVNDKRIDPEAIVMLNITGGGIERLQREKKTFNFEPAVVIEKEDFVQHKVENILEKIF